MAFIFTASTDIGSSRHTSRIIGPFLRWFNPNVSEETIHLVQVVVRKAGHLSEYGLLATLILRALGLYQKSRFIWSSRVAGQAFALTVLYACTDEFHQLYVPSRDASVRDVVIDSCGAFVALLLIWLWTRYSKRTRPTA
jgi:VanZ family protein